MSEMWHPGWQGRHTDTWEYELVTGFVGPAGGIESLFTAASAEPPTELKGRGLPKELSAEDLDAATTWLVSAARRQSVILAAVMARSVMPHDAPSVVVMTSPSAPVRAALSEALEQAALAGSASCSREQLVGYALRIQDALVYAGAVDVDGALAAQHALGERVRALTDSHVAMSESGVETMWSRCTSVIVSPAAPAPGRTAAHRALSVAVGDASRDLEDLRDLVQHAPRILAGFVRWLASHPERLDAWSPDGSARDIASAWVMLVEYLRAAGAIDDQTSQEISDAGLEHLVRAQADAAAPPTLDHLRQLERQRLELAQRLEEARRDVVTEGRRLHALGVSAYAIAQHTEWSQPHWGRLLGSRSDES